MVITKKGGKTSKIMENQRKSGNQMVEDIILKLKKMIYKNLL